MLCLIRFYILCVFIYAAILYVIMRRRTEEREIVITYHTHRLIGVLVSNLTTYGMLILVAGVRQLRVTYEVTC